MAMLARILGAVLLGIILGVGAALLRAGVLLPQVFNPGEKVLVGAWIGDWGTGSASASPGHRAWVAVNGLLAMTVKDAVYLIAPTDDAGDPLLETCTYRLSGGEQDAFWWTITLYEESGYLPDNSGEALSVDATSVGPGRWQAIISPEREDEDLPWLSSAGGGQFNLLLRLYRPSDEILTNPEATIDPPRIERLECVS